MYYLYKDNAPETFILTLLKNGVVLLFVLCRISKNILTSLKRIQKRESKNTSSIEL